MPKANYFIRVNFTVYIFNADGIKFVTPHIIFLNFPQNIFSSYVHECYLCLYLLTPKYMYANARLYLYNLITNNPSSSDGCNLTFA